MLITCCELLAQDINDYVYTCIYGENRIIIKERVRVGRVIVMSKEESNLFIIVVSFSFSTNKNLTQLFIVQQNYIVIISLIENKKRRED